MTKSNDDAAAKAVAAPAESKELKSPPESKELKAPLETKAPPPPKPTPRSPVRAQQSLMTSVGVRARGEVFLATEKEAKSYGRLVKPASEEDLQECEEARKIGGLPQYLALRARKK